MRSLGILKRLTRESAIYGISTAMGRFVYLLLAPILTRIFSPEDYGVIALIQLAIGFATIFGGLNVSSGIGFHFFKAERLEDKNNVLAGGFWVSVAIAALISGAFAFFAPQVVQLLQIREEGPILGYDLELYLQVGALGMFFGIMQTGLASMLRFLGRPYHYVVVQLSHILPTVVSVLVFVMVFETGLLGVFLGGAVGAICGFFVAFLMLVGRLLRSPVQAILLAVLFYALPQIPAAILNWGQTQIGRYCINLFLSLREQGIYSVGFAIASTLIMVTTAFRLAYDPFALSVMKNPEAPVIYAKTYKLYVCVFGIVLSFLAALGQPLVQMIFPESYLEAHRLIPLLATGFFYLGASNILATGIWVSGRTVFTSYAQGLAFLLLVPANLLLVPVIGPLGGAVAFLTGNLAYNLFVFLFSQKLFHVPYSYWRTHLWALGANLMFWGNAELTTGLSLIELAAVGLLVACFCVALIWILFLNRNDHNLFKLFLQNLERNKSTGL
jgi:O-antigen/teichoic acid export membrane protein